MYRFGVRIVGKAVHICSHVERCFPCAWLLTLKSFIMFPPAPVLGALRIASSTDILRIGVVATSGFYYSPAFQWERPYHANYPADTLASYRTEWANIVKDPNYIVLVATDKYDSEEGLRSKAIIPPDNGTKTPAAGEDVIVGMGCWKLEKGSKRVGQLHNNKGKVPLQCQVLWPLNHQRQIP